MKGHTSVRRRAAMRGNATLAFLLGVCAGIAFLIVLFKNLDERPPPRSRLPADVALSPDKADSPEEGPSGSLLDPPTKPRRPINNNDSGDWRVTSDLKLDTDAWPPPPAREEPKPEPIVEKPFGPLVRHRGAEDDDKDKEDDDKEDEDDPAPPQEDDHIVSATKYQYYLAKQFSLGFRDVAGIYYLEVVLSSPQPRRWSMSEDEWFSLRDRIKAVSRGGGRYKCAHMWPISVEGRIEIWMLFRIPDRARIKGILLDKKRLPIAEVVDSGK